MFASISDRQGRGGLNQFTTLPRIVTTYANKGLTF